MTDREMLLERLERLAIVLDELMPRCAELVRDAIVLLKKQDKLLRKLQKDKDKLCLDVSEWKHKYHDGPLKEQEPKPDKCILCEGCGHKLQDNWNWCPWCKLETARGRRVKLE